MAVVTPTLPMQGCGCGELCCPNAELCPSPTCFLSAPGQQHPLRARGCRLAGSLAVPAATVILNMWLLPARCSPALPGWLLATGQPWRASLSPHLHPQK